MAKVEEKTCVITLHYIKISLLREFPYGLYEISSHVREVHVARNLGSFLTVASKKRAPPFYSFKKINSANNLSLKVDFSPIKFR